MVDPGVKLTAAAITPLFPSSPNKPIIVTLGVLGSGFFELILLLIVTRLPKPLRSSTELEDYLQMHTLGIMPAVKLKASRDVRTMLVGNPRSVLAEALNGILTKLDLQLGSSTWTMLITSGLPSEGKTTLSLALAVVAAQSGKRVCLVDMDLKRSGLSKSLGWTPGSRDGQNSDFGLFSTSTWEDQATNITMISVKTSQPEAQLNHNRVLSSPALKSMLDELRSNHDLVVINSPPVLAVSDALKLARMADAIVLAVRWGYSTVEEVRQTVKELEPYEEKIAGAIFTRVDVNAHSEFGFKDRSYYYHQVRAYYTVADPEPLQDLDLDPEPMTRQHRPLQRFRKSRPIIDDRRLVTSSLGEER